MCLSRAIERSSRTNYWPPVSWDPFSLSYRYFHFIYFCHHQILFEEFLHNPVISGLNEEDLERTLLRFWLPLSLFIFPFPTLPLPLEVILHQTYHHNLSSTAAQLWFSLPCSPLKSEFLWVNTLMASSKPPQLVLPASFEFMSTLSVEPSQKSRYNIVVKSTGSGGKQTWG